MKTKIAVIVFPGSNCDHDAYYVLNKVFGVDVGFVWHKETNLDDYDAVLIPGGFSYGDYLRTGAIARFSPIMESVIQSSKNGKPIIGICNGFQILLECGLLPGALINNSEIKFLSKSVTLEVVSKKSIFSNKLDVGEKMKMPIAHRQGNYIADKSVLNDLTNQDRIILLWQR